DLLGKNLANATRLARDVGAERRNHAAVTGRIAMRPRQVALDDRGNRTLARVAFQRALPDALAPRQREANRLGCDRFFRSELAVQPAVSKAGVIGDGVDAGARNALLAEQTRGRGQDSFAIVRGLFLRYPHPNSSTFFDQCLTHMITSVINMPNMTTVINRLIERDV